MARVTVEDCIDKVNNRFELILLAGHRSRLLGSGSSPVVPRDRDKDTVVSLREIADSKIMPDDLREDFIHSMQKYVEVDEPEPELVPRAAPAALTHSSQHNGSSIQINAADDNHVTFDRMSEEELLRGLEGLVPPRETDDED